MFVLCNYALPLRGSVTPEKHKEFEVLQQHFDSNEVCVFIGLQCNNTSHTSLSIGEWKTENLK
jgi:hypothetical protein